MQVRFREGFLTACHLAGCEKLFQLSLRIDNLPIVIPSRCTLLPSKGHRSNCFNCHSERKEFIGGKVWYKYNYEQIKHIKGEIHFCCLQVIQEVFAVPSRDWKTEKGLLHSTELELPFKITNLSINDFPFSDCPVWGNVPHGCSVSGTKLFWTACAAWPWIWWLERAESW